MNLRRYQLIESTSNTNCFVPDTPVPPFTLFFRLHFPEEKFLMAF